MKNSECNSCFDPIKRCIAFTRDPSSVCVKCKILCLRPIVIEEEKQTLQTAPFSFDIMKNKKKTMTFFSFQKLSRYVRLLLEQISKQETSTMVTQARSNFNLTKKLRSLDVRPEDRYGLVCAVKRCYKKDFDIDRSVAYLKPKGGPYEKIASYLQDIYETYFK